MKPMAEKSYDDLLNELAGTVLEGLGKGWSIREMVNFVMTQSLSWKAENTPQVPVAFNRLTPPEAERLALLTEEMGESLQCIGKILRHGYESCHPASPDGPDNRASLVRELGDVQMAVNLMHSWDDVDRHSIDERAKVKRGTVGLYLHHNRIPVPPKREDDLDDI